MDAKAKDLRIDSVPIRDMDGYNHEMSRALYDKGFFLNQVDADLFVDFGCANGAMLGFIDRVYPGVRLAGFDVDPKMIGLAKAENPGDGIVYSSSWEEIGELVEETRAAGRKSCLVLSSVIHEAYSYMTKSEIDAMWDLVWGRGAAKFDYVAIRDMMVSKTTSRPSDPLAVARIRQVFDQDWIDRWEANWGSLSEGWSMVHFLLTYRYLKLGNERELYENYLPVNYENFISSIPHEFMPVFQEHFTLPFLRRKVREDFGIELADRTHIKLVLERRDQ